MVAVAYRELVAGSQFAIGRSPRRGRSWSGELMLQVCLHGWPLARQDAVHTRVAQCFVGCSLMVAQHPIQFRPETLDRAPTLMIEEVGAKLHRDTVKLLKGMG